MTRDDLLTEYENTWRAQALVGVPQFFGNTGEAVFVVSPMLHDCAATAGKTHVLSAATHTKLRWHCPLDNCFGNAVSLAETMVHLNDTHRWDWLMFANKFRDILAEGERLADGAL